MVEGVAAPPAEELAIEDKAVQTTADQPRVRGRSHIVEARRV